MSADRELTDEEKRAERSAYYRAMGAANPPGTVMDYISPREAFFDNGAGRAPSLGKGAP